MSKQIQPFKHTIHFYARALDHALFGLERSAIVQLHSSIPQAYVRPLPSSILPKEIGRTRHIRDDLNRSVGGSSRVANS